MKLSEAELNTVYRALIQSVKWSESLKDANKGVDWFDHTDCQQHIDKCNKLIEKIKSH